MLAIQRCQHLIIASSRPLASPAAVAQARRLGWAAIVLLPLAGCGPSDRATVTGTVLRHDGSPLVNARVMARSDETGASPRAYTDANGRYHLGIAQEGEGIPPGDYYVVILEDRGDPERLRERTISEKYQNRNTSGLSFSVEAGERKVFDVTLDPL